MKLFFRLGADEELGLLGGLSSAAVVVITTAGTSQLLAGQGSDSLAVVYLLLAILSIPLASTLCGLLGRRTAVDVYRRVSLVAATAAAALQAALVFEVPGASIAACVGAYAFEIVFDTMYWLVLGEYLATGDLKRRGPRLALFFAAGGAAGGILTSIFCAVFPPIYVMSLGAIIFPLAYLQCARVSGRLQSLTGNASFEDEPGMVEALRSAVNVCRAFPISGLLALAVALMSALYCVQDYLSMSIFSAEFDDEDVLAQFIGFLFAAQQAAEMLVLAVVGRLVLNRTGPLTRNLLFPLASAFALLMLLFSPSVAAAVFVSVNANSLSNGLFEPVKSMNYAAIPYKARASVRVLVEGIVYPAGIGLSGVALFFLQSAIPFHVMVSVAAGFCGLFLVASAAIGTMFVPSLIQGIRVRAVNVGRQPLPSLKKILSPVELDKLLQHPDAGVRHDIQLMLQAIPVTNCARAAKGTNLLLRHIGRARFAPRVRPQATGGLPPVTPRPPENEGAVPAAFVLWPSPPAYRLARCRLRALYERAKLNLTAAAVVKEIMEEKHCLQHARPVLDMLEQSRRDIVRQALSVQASVEDRRDVLLLGHLLEKGDTQERSEAFEALTSLPSGSLIKPLLVLLEPGSACSDRVPRDGLGKKSSAAERDAVLWEATQGNPVARLLVAPLLQNIRPLPNDPEDRRMLDIIIFLKSVSLFRELSFESIARAARSAEAICAREGEWIRSSEVRCSDVVVLRDGQADLYFDGCAVDTMKPGSFIGASLLSGGDEQELAAQAVSDCFVIAIPGSVIADLCAENPWMLRHVLSEVIRMQRQAYGRVAAARRGEMFPADREGIVLPQRSPTPLRRA